MNHVKHLLLILLFTSCAQVPTPSQRTDQADHLASRSNWHQALIETDDFTLLTYQPEMPAKAEILTIYIEGDGLAWINSSTPSTNPTPIAPLALKLALRDTVPSVYLARPCQFITQDSQRNCSKKYWTSHRFALEVIKSSSQAIDQLKQQFGSTKLILVGYSGGGAVAALVATQRHDVIRLITIAGNLDPRTWVAEHHLSPLSGSLNPADVWQQLQHIPQTHYVGGKDKTIGESVTRAYAARFPEESAPEVVVIPDFDHHCCWVERWPSLKNEVSDKRQSQ